VLDNLRRSLPSLAVPGLSWSSARLAVVLLGPRLAVAALRGNRMETFTLEAESPGTALRAELDARRIAARSVALGLWRGAVTVKPVDLPPVAGELRDMVQFELERHLPFAADDAPFDFVPLPAVRADDPSAGQRVLVAAADRRIVEAVLRVAEEARLRPASITVAAHDLVSLVQAPRRRRIVWVHRSALGIDLLFLVGPLLLLSRNLPDSDEALVVDEIRRSLALARFRRCDAVWVSGDGDEPVQLDPGPFAALDAPVTAPPWTPRARAWMDDVPDDSRGVLQLAMGAAAARRARSLDLLPAPLKPRRLTRAQALTVATAAAAGLLVVAALLAPGYRASRHLARINAEMARLDPEVRAVDALHRELEGRSQLLNTVDQLETASLKPLPVLRELTELLPSDAWLTMVSLDGKGVELTGQAAAAAALIPVLENSARLERVEFSSPVTRGRDREQFRIRAGWEGTPPPGAPKETPPAPRAAAGTQQGGPR
jgi:Tfp pilus assembly protein PilN